ncbi:MAG: hypothetical protein ABEJ56_00525 [Candidatus Nanohaloarchaea archaeon]
MSKTIHDNYGEKVNGWVNPDLDRSGSGAEVSVAKPRKVNDLLEEASIDSRVYGDEYTALLKRQEAFSCIVGDAVENLERCDFSFSGEYESFDQLKREAVGGNLPREALHLEWNDDNDYILVFMPDDLEAYRLLSPDPGAEEGIEHFAENYQPASFFTL